MMDTRIPSPSAPRAESSLALAVITSSPELDQINALIAQIDTLIKGNSNLIASYDTTDYAQAAKAKEARKRIDDLLDKRLTYMAARDAVEEALGIRTAFTRGSGSGLSGLMGPAH